MPYIYMLMGFLVGFMVGAEPQHTVGFPLQRFGYVVVALLVILLYLWFERTSHDRHLLKWENHRRRGRRNFVLFHYVVARAIPILLISTVPINSRVHLARQSIYVLVFTSCIALVALTFVGYQEWSACESDFSVRSMKEAAQRFKESGSDLASGGV